MFKRKLGESGSRHGKSGSRYSNFFKFITDFLNFKWLNQPFKRSIWQKRSQECNVLSPLIYLKVRKNCIYRHSCRLPDSASRGVVFRLRISPWIWSPNRNGSKYSVRNLCRTDFCKNPRKSASLPCPFNISAAGTIRISHGTWQWSQKESTEEAFLCTHRKIKRRPQQRSSLLIISMGNGRRRRERETIHHHPFSYFLSLFY